MHLHTHLHVRGSRAGEGSSLTPDLGGTSLSVISSLVVMSLWHPRLRLLFVLLGIRPITTAAPLRGEYGRMADWTSQTQVGSPTLASTLARSTRRSICPQTASTRTRRSQPLTSSPPRQRVESSSRQRVESSSRHSNTVEFGTTHSLQGTVAK